MVNLAIAHENRPGCVCVCACVRSLFMRLTVYILSTCVISKINESVLNTEKDTQEPGHDDGAYQMRWLLTRHAQQHKHLYFKSICKITILKRGKK